MYIHCFYYSDCVLSCPPHSPPQPALSPGPRDPQPGEAGTPGQGSLRPLWDAESGGGGQAPGSTSFSPMAAPLYLTPGIFFTSSSPRRTLLFSALMVVSATLVTVFLWERRVKHNNFYPKQDISTLNWSHWTPVLKDHLSSSGSVLGAWYSPHQCPLPHPQTFEPQETPQTFSAANPQTITWSDRSMLSRLTFNLGTPKPALLVRQTLGQAHQQVCRLWDLKIPAQPEE